MKTKRDVKVLICLLAVLGLFCLCGCADPSSTGDDASAVEPIDLSVSIDYPAKAKKPDLKTLPFRAEEDCSVLQVVELFGNVNDISILVDTTYSTLEGVDGVINGVTLKTGEWQYQINGETMDKPISEVILKDGDHLELVYKKAEVIE